MRKVLSKKETELKIREFFEREIFDPREVRKIKRIAMKLNIRLGEYKKKFCKKCYFKLNGKTSINRGWKSVECKNCRHVNRWKIK